jgi:receptor protein-tyrosine kinase
MSRVHDALRRAEQIAAQTGVPLPKAPPVEQPTQEAVAAAVVEEAIPAASAIPAEPPPAARPEPVAAVLPAEPEFRIATTVTREVLPSEGPLNLREVLARVQEVPFTPSPDAHLIDAQRPHQPPTEEFRTLRTRLNHLQSLQPIHSVIVTSPSPAEGKSITASNLALAQSHLSHNLTLLADFDLRRPALHQLFQIDRSPGVTDYLLGKVRLEDAIKRIAGTNLYVMPAGEAVINPLELMNLPAVKELLAELPTIFNWVILDSPPLLFAADGALLGTMCHGTILVTRIGHTTVDSVTRAIHSLCENNILGIVVNGARRGELYSKYTYYHSYYSSAKA